MKKIALWLAIMTLGLCLGCQGKFKHGQVVNLKIGGKGQIITIDHFRPYRVRVRIRTENGIESHWFYEFELEVTP